MAVSQHNIAFEDIQEQAQKIARAIKMSGGASLEPLLHFFNIRRQPCSLKDYFLLRPLYQTERPRRTLFQLARQIGKTTNSCGSNTCRNIVTPDYASLYVTPLFEQIKRLSTEVLTPFLNSSMFRDAFEDDVDEQQMLKKTFWNGSKQHFSFAFLDPERIRGYSGICECLVDEIQDLSWEFLPVIGETMSGRLDKYGFYQFTGTPKSLANTMNYLWRESAQCEWVTKCEHCNKYNIASTDHDLLNMIGKTTCVCGKCRKPLDCSRGTYIPRFPDRMADFAGYHAPQIVHPLHYLYPRAWKELHRKINNYPKWRLYNEVFGESYDSASRLLTSDQFRQACREWKNSIRNLQERVQYYDPVVIGIDWSGGGEDGHSYTAVSVGGVRKGRDWIDTIYCTKVPLHVLPDKQVSFILYLYSILTKAVKNGTILVAHDYGGAGNVYERIMVNGGIPAKALVPFTYSVTNRKDVIHYEAPTGGHRSSFSLDKPRSLVILAAMLKSGKVRLPSYESQQMEMLNGDPVGADLLKLFGEVSERPGRADVYMVKKEPQSSDDFANALNYMCSAAWYYHGNYPSLADAMNLKFTNLDLENICPEEPDWFNSG